MKKAMRDVLLSYIYNQMETNENVYFVSADFGSPVIDKIKESFKKRFVNVGIAEQNLINVSSGLAFEGNIVYAYAIAPFISMRAFEQLRNNLSILSNKKSLNVNLISVGAGVSYDLSGPSHHCLEDLSIMRVLPSFSVFSLSDYSQCLGMAQTAISSQNPKYIRLDGKPLENIFKENEVDFQKGFKEVIKGEEVCIVSTGYMVRKAIKIAQSLKTKGLSAGVVDVFRLKPVPDLSSLLSKYGKVFSIEEGFINVGGLDCLILHTIAKNNLQCKFLNAGFDDKYAFQLGFRENIYKKNKLGDKYLEERIIKWK